MWHYRSSRASFPLHYRLLQTRKGTRASFPVSSCGLIHLERPVPLPPLLGRPLRERVVVCRFFYPFGRLPGSRELASTEKPWNSPRLMRRVAAYVCGQGFAPCIVPFALCVRTRWTVLAPGPIASTCSATAHFADSVSTRSAGRSRFLCVGTPWEVLASHACPSSKGPAVTLLRCITDGLSLRYSVFPQSAPWPLERFSCARKGQCKCCAENYGTRSRWPGSNRHRPQFCFRAALPLSYSGICAAGRKRQSPAAIGMDVCGHERTRKAIITRIFNWFPLLSGIF